MHTLNILQMWLQVTHATHDVRIRERGWVDALEEKENAKMYATVTE